MIYSELDGQIAFPKADSSVKITKENPFISSSDSYSYDITYPLDIPENRAVFGNVNRIDVRKKLVKFKVCRLYAGNRLVISGTGIITGNTDKEVKVQIVTGKSELKYNVRTDNLFIDQIDAYNDPSSGDLSSFGMTIFSGTNKEGQDTLNGQAYTIDTTVLESKQYLGDPKRYVFMPVYDNTNDAMANQFCYMRISPKGDAKYVILNRTCIQPNLLMVVRNVLSFIGYDYDLSYIDKSPWNLLIIANAHRTMKVRDALPHWTVTTFLDQVANLFNASWIFDEVGKKVTLMGNENALTAGEQSYDCLDEYTTEHDNDGIAYIGSSNIKYNLDAGGNYGTEIISQDNLKAFGVKDFKTHSDLIDYLSGLSTRERLVTIGHSPQGYYYYRYPKESDRQEGNDNIELACFGQFTSLVRDINSDTNVELRIVPVAMGVIEMNQLTFQCKEKYETTKYGIYDTGIQYWELCDRYRFTDNLPSVENPHDETDDYDTSFVSVQDAVEDDEDKTSETKEDDSNMFVGWVASQMVRFPNESVSVERDNLSSAKRIDMWSGGGYFPMLYSDWYLNIDHGNATDNICSMSLNTVEGFSSIGDFHKKQTGRSVMNQYDQVVIKFLSDDIPNPRKLFMFRNKLFLCKKIEITVSDEGIDKLKTGYFYEI